MIMKMFKSKPNHQYPLMRDPLRNPKCYEMTDDERKRAIEKIDLLLSRKNKDGVKE